MGEMCWVGEVEGGMDGGKGVGKVWVGNRHFIFQTSCKGLGRGRKRKSKSGRLTWALHRR